jgi:uncharacterized membrane protein YgdD (TMEM256/DUF423 family)
VHRASRWWNIAGTFFLAGIILFCGGLFAVVFTRDPLWGQLVRFGGIGFIIGWLVMAGGCAAGRFRVQAAAPAPPSGKR